MRQVIPDEVWTQHVAILAKTGKGKTVAAKGGMTALLRAKLRCGAFDPTGGWWGMRLKSDGKTPAFPMVIFGGLHGDIAIDETMGAKIGKLVAESDFSWIIDTKKMTRDQRTRFATDFAEAVFAANHRRLHLFVDECHLMMPKEKMASRAAGKMTTVWNDLVTGGRSNGFCITLISQRPQKVHNDALAQCETLITLGMLLPHDIDAVKRWVTVKDADSKEAKDMIASLPGLPRGEGWIYAPEMNMLKRVKFPMIDTFDSSAAPDASADLRAPPVELGQIDLEAIRASLAPPVRKAVPIAPRPATSVRAPVAGTGAKLVSEAVALKDREAAFAAGLREGRETGWTEGWRIGHPSGFSAGVSAAHQTLLTDLKEMTGRIRAIPYPGDAFRPPKSGKFIAPAAGSTASVSAAPGRAPALRATTYPPAAQRQPAARATAAENGIKPSLQRALDAIAWWRKIGADPVERDRACVVAGFSPKASTFGVYIAELVQMGHVSVSSGYVALTDSGLELAHTPDAATNEDIRDHARGLLKPQEQRVFDVIYGAWPEPISRDDIANAVGLSRTASTVGVYIAGVVKYGIVETSGRGGVKAANWLFPEGA